ncbi:secretin N-terminal domain-containing protein [Chlamydiota bacterium]
MKKRMKSIFISAVLLMNIVSFVFAQDVHINFEDTDIAVIIKFVSDMTGKNFVIDETVKGKVSIICPKKIPLEELYDVMESVLFVKGFTMISDGSVIRIVPLANARQNDFMTFSDSVSAGLENRFYTHIISLRHANVFKAHEIVKPLLTTGGYASLYEPTNTIIITDLKENVLRIVRVIEELDKASLDKTAGIHVYSLKYSDATNVSEILNKLFEERYNAALRFGKKDGLERSYAIADSFTNTLIIHVPPQEIRNIEKIIQTIDVRKKQILVEVLILEANLDKTAEIGIEWASIDGVMVGTPKGFGKDRVNTLDDILPYILTGGNPLGYSASFVHDVKTIGSIEIPRIGALVTAYQNDEDVNILSAPQIVTSDNEEAYILIGENRAFIKNAQVTAEGGTVRTFEFKDVGLSLRITPHICEDNYVKLTIDQKIENVIGESFEGAVETAKREAKTHVIVKDRGTIVIGGLVNDHTVNYTQKVPLLGNIPLLGMLFRHQYSLSVKKNLMIFLSPRIIESNETMTQLTIQKKDLFKKKEDVSGSRKRFKKRSQKK